MHSALQGFGGEFFPDNAGNVRVYTITYQDLFVGTNIPNTNPPPAATIPGLTFQALSPANAITVAQTRHGANHDADEFVCRHYARQH